MKKNIGNVDRVIRILLALLVAGLYYQGTISGITGIILLIVAAVLVATVFIGTCPIYLGLGLSTRKNT
jgi:K+-transporting ATPase A subunit